QSSDFLTEWLLQHPVHDFLNGFRFLAEIAMSAERITRPGFRRAAARNGNERILIRQPSGIAVWRAPALIADVVDKQKRSLDRRKIKSAQTGPRLDRPPDLSKHSR